MDDAEIEIRLLRRWASQFTWMNDKQIESADAETLKEELDATGRMKLHRVGWFDNVETLGGLHVIGTERHEAGASTTSCAAGRAGRATTGRAGSTSRSKTT
jgi:preprotein translocase subunit SecA